MPKKIIIIEDDHDILDMMQYILEDEGYEVVVYRFAALVDEIVQGQPHLILLDEKLPDKSGHELCTEIKKHPGLKGIPVILVSADSKIEQIASNCKADGYIAKPFDLTTLIDLVHRFS
ncbi:response regulator [Mucilaginibacter sp. BJC16-A38]|uniref:response regulator n=1 Tax=Mucilaginibacter phenanthrenivorans TaxID=1234842 RepID=UPI0021573B94|nr:response regulator [Mucilaginibacter phenanthrenivorans]MCR8561992.1 response regulator [Mucilaginibacter phenanthrenivorans]